MSSLSPADVFNLFDNSAFPGDTGRRERGIGGGRWDMDGSIRSRERFYRGVNGYFVKVMYAPVKPFLFSPEILPQSSRFDLPSQNYSCCGI